MRRRCQARMVTTFPRLEGQKAYLDYGYLMKLQDFFVF